MKTFKKNVDVFVLAVGIVLIWRGVWGLTDMYLLPNMPAVSLLVSIAAGVLILIIHNPRKKDISELL